MSAESVASILNSFILVILVVLVAQPTFDVALLSILFIDTVPPTASLSAASTETEIPQISEVFSELTESFEEFVATPVTEPP